MPDRMSDMMEQKISLRGRCNCAWVPSPTAASHALHYHRINIFDKHVKNKKADLDITYYTNCKTNWSLDEINRNF